MRKNKKHSENNVNQQDITTIPKQSASDVVYVIAKTGLSILGPLSEAFGGAIQPPINKRRDEWVARIAQEVEHLKERFQDFRSEKLANNDNFISAFLQASQIAITAHEKEKLEALQNAVLNSALPSAPDASIQQTFLSFINTFTIWHIRILKLFYNPGSIEEARGIFLSDLAYQGEQDYLPIIIRFMFSELADEMSADFIEIIKTDLKAKNLLTTNHYAIIANYGDEMDWKNRLKSINTAIGRKFIEFIESPIEG